MRRTPSPAVAARALGALSLLSLLAGGCGGGGGGGSGALLVDLPAAVDGVVDGTGFVETTGAMNLGDSSVNVGIHGYLRFDLSAVPAGATILSATLITRQTASGFFGTPYTDLGNLLVDHMDIGAALGSEDFVGTTFTFALAVLSTDPVLETKTADVTAAVTADLAAARTTSDYRLRFAADTNSDAGPDFVQFSTSEFDAGTGVTPTLEVTYLP